MFAGCRCPRCADATLVATEVDGHKVLACRHCAGAFVGAEFGLRLLAILQPEVPPRRVGVPSPACPVCRQDMRRVIAEQTEVETCKTHGVWFDAGDLSAIVQAVAQALGKPVPRRPAPASPPQPAPSPPSAPPRKSRPVPRRTAADDVLETADVLVFSPLDAAADIVLFPFHATLDALDIIGSLID